MGLKCSGSSSETGLDLLDDKGELKRTMPYVDWNRGGFLVEVDEVFEILQGNEPGDPAGERQATGEAGAVTESIATEDGPVLNTLHRSQRAFWALPMAGPKGRSNTVACVQPKKATAPPSRR